jgi:SNF2 family DNA or RNA helicase
MKYKWKQRPYRHQIDAVKKLMSNGFGGALLMEPRTGKTKVAIDYASIMHLKGEVNRVLIFCPLGVIGVWVDEFEANCPIPYRILVWDKHKRKTGHRKEQQLPEFGKNVLDVVLVNYDALSTPGQWRIRKHRDGTQSKIRARRGGRFDVMRKIKAWQPQMIILDESHRIKSPTAKKTSALLSLKDPVPYRVIMTGTVVTKSKRLFDIYAQWKFLNEGRFQIEGKQMTLGEFKSEFGKWLVRQTSGGAQYSKYLGPRNENRLHRLIHKDAFSITREECYDLPKETIQKIYVDLEESYDVYVRMAEDMVARIETGEITEASIKLVQRLRLQQITSGLFRTSPSPDYPEGRIYIGGSEKLRAIQSRLEDLMEADEKVVIGALFKPDLQRLEHMINKKLKVPLFIVKGGVKPADREYARKQFHKVSGGAIFLGQPAAAGEGIDLSCASILQWYSLTSSWVNYRQFTDRIALSERPTFHEFFLARGTIDDIIYEGTLEDQNVGKMMITSPERLLKLRERGD